MNSSLGISRVWMVLVAFGALVLYAGAAHAQSASQLSAQVSEVASRVSSAESNESTAGQVISELDRLEALYAKVASEPSTNQMALEPSYHQLESSLSTLYNTYKKKKDDCIAQIDAGGQCDYSVPEQLSLQALYPLSWLKFQGATSVYANNEAQAKRLLNEAIDGFTESTLVIVDPNLVRENLLGRANCEKELGKFEHPEYDKAIADFKKILEDGSATAQYKAANQGLATTYSLMGKPEEAQKYTQGMASTGGSLMLQLQTLFSAENATSDPAKKAAYHKQIVDKIKAVEDNKQNWAIAVAAIGKYVRNPVEEFGNSSDPFEKWLLANVLLSKHDENGAAKYYIEAARASGKYNKGYRYAADIYYKQKRFDQVEQLANEMAKSGGADAQWAAYMAYALPRQQWEASGMKNTQLNDQWIKGAENYLSKFSGGQYAAEMRFRLGENLQRQGKYLEAAKQYEQVSGQNEYAFTAKFNSAECKYLELVQGENSKENSKDKTASSVNVDQLRNDTMKDLQETIKMEPEAERTAQNGQQKKFVHDVKGRAIYMLAGLMQEKNPDPKVMADLLQNYESQYPAMSDKFRDVQEWRIVALSQLGRYDDVDRDLAAIVEKNKGNTAQSDFIKELGLDFWKAAQAAQDKGDDKTFKANAKLTVTAYTFFEDMVQSGKTQAKNLTGTLSILGKAYMGLGEEQKADAIFSQVVKADPASPDANAGLATIAQAKNNYKDAITLWTNVENTAAESDNLWYEAKYNIAVIYAARGDIPGACSKLAQTRAEHPTLGTPEIAARWNTLQRKICLDHK